MSRPAARLLRAEQAAHQRTLDELAKRRGFLRWAIFARDAEPDPAQPGEWRSDTVDLILSLPSSMTARALELVDDLAGGVWICPEPNHDAE